MQAILIILCFCDTKKGLLNSYHTWGVKDQALLQAGHGSQTQLRLMLLWLWYRPSCSSNSTPSLGTSICHRCGHSERKKEKEREREISVTQPFPSKCSVSTCVGTKIKCFLRYSFKITLSDHRILWPNDVNLRVIKINNIFIKKFALSLCIHPIFTHIDSIHSLFLTQ